MINEKYAKEFCLEDISLIENYGAAVSDTTQTWHCHHRLETEQNMSVEELKFCSEYINLPASRLIFLTPHDHLSLHFTGNKFHRKKPHSVESKNKISASRKGKNVGNTIALGRIWFNDGQRSVMAYECPTGFQPGRLYSRHKNKTTNKQVEETLNGCCFHSI